MAKTEPFDRHADRYDLWFEENRFAYISELEALRALVPSGARGLEIGSGTARFAEPLGIEFGVDPSMRMNLVAKGRGLGVVCGIAEALPFLDESFEFALMVTTICYVDDPLNSFREARRVLVPSGQMILGFIDRDSPLGREYEKRKGSSLFYGPATFYSTAEILKLLEKAGFEDFSIVQTIFSDPRTLTGPEPARNGFGEGSFVAISGKKC